MISSSSVASISSQLWPSYARAQSGTHGLRGMLALACPKLLPMLPGKGHEKQADERQDREDDFCSLADFCNKALVGSGDM